MTTKITIDPILIMLAWMIGVTVALVVLVEYLMPSDGKLFQFTSQLASGFSGAFIMRVRPQTKQEEAAQDGGSQSSVTVTQSNMEPAKQ